MAERRQRNRGAQARVLSLAELEEVRLILRGGSVVDWYRLNYDHEDDINAFLRLCEMDLDDPACMARLAAIRRRAADYLDAELRYEVPEKFVTCPVQDLFLKASNKRGRRRDRFMACLLLKVMHIVFHADAREFRHGASLPQDEIADLLLAKVNAFQASLIDSEFPLAAFSGGKKSKSSVYTKLLLKRSYHAATIHDMVRFKFVVEKPSDLIPLINKMARELIPFNYVVPSASINHLINFTALVESHAAYRDQAPKFQVELGHEEQALRPLNEFSAETYQVINFVADMPVAVPEYKRPKAVPPQEEGRVVFALAEFQLVDAVTEAANEKGAAAHEAYKGRQISAVRERLERGMRPKGP
jgi:uncharacterized protein (TIGR04552 family)